MSVANLEGLSSVEILHTGRRSITQRGIRNGRPVIIKTIRGDIHSPAEISAFRREYEILKDLQFEGIPRTLDYIAHGNRQAILFEDIGGVPLDAAIAQRKRLPLEEFFSFSIRLAGIVEKLHDAGITHRDIKPANIVQSSTGVIQIIDFGSASSFARERVVAGAKPEMEGTLAYMSPEQTGRINRVVDYRTDYYSLGVTFFEMLTGVLPFSSRDPMELVHSHIAVLPPTPSELHVTIPRTVSRIILLMLEKTPEARYQSAQGLVADLRRCHKELNADGAVSDFTPGSDDRSSLFSIPEQLFGRKHEKQILEQALQGIIAGSQATILITGEPGSGKSSLVSECQRPVIEARDSTCEEPSINFKRINLSALFASHLMKHCVRLSARMTSVSASGKSASRANWRDTLLQSRAYFHRFKTSCQSSSRQQPWQEPNSKDKYRRDFAD